MVYIYYIYHWMVNLYGSGLEDGASFPNSEFVIFIERYSNYPVILV